MNRKLIGIKAGIFLLTAIGILLSIVFAQPESFRGTLYTYAILGVRTKKI